jgi:predicted nucleic acid-binding protein
LHCFEYGRDEAKELDALCEEVFYYPRLTGLKSNISIKPYIVNSRRSEPLMENLLKNNYPILFEGLHSCFYMDDPRLKNRRKIYRESNIEHHYYYHLYKSEKSVFQKAFFLCESWRLKLYQKKLSYADLMLVVSMSDTEYLKKHFPGKQVEYLPSFHPNDDFTVIPGKGDYIFYHGKLSVQENYHAAEYLIQNIFRNTKHKLIIAGMDPPEHLKKLCNETSNVELIEKPDDETMFKLIQNAQANILITFQATGLKLKLLNTLYKGRFCIVNPEMVQGTGLESLCKVGKTDKELKQLIGEVFDMDFSIDEVKSRGDILRENYTNKINAARLVGLVF